MFNACKAIRDARGDGRQCTHCARKRNSTFDLMEMFVDDYPGQVDVRQVDELRGLQAISSAYPLVVSSSRCADSDQSRRGICGMSAGSHNAPPSGLSAVASSSSGQRGSAVDQMLSGSSNAVSSRLSVEGSSSSGHRSSVVSAAGPLRGIISSSVAVGNYGHRADHGAVPCAAIVTTPHPSSLSQVGGSMPASVRQRSSRPARENHPRSVVQAFVQPAPSTFRSKPQKQ